MTTAPHPEPQDAARSALMRHGLLVAAALAVLMVGGAALFAWGLAGMIDGPAAAPLAAALSVAALSLPLGWLVLTLQRQVEQGRQQLQRLGASPSAGHAGRAQFIGLAEREWARVRRYGGEPALLLVEVDRFPRLLEARGVDAGEAVMRELLRDLGPSLRGGDAYARFGGSQVAVWLTQADPIGALDVADRIRERSEALEIAWHQQTVKFTVSVGVAAVRPVHPNLTSLIADAEAAVLAARQAGGNCVRAAPVDPTRSRQIGPSVGDNQAAGPL